MTDLQKTVLDALKHYNNLDELQSSPLSKLDVTTVPAEARQEVLASHATGLAVRGLLDRAIGQLGERLPEAAELLDERFRQKVPIRAMSEKQHLSRQALYKHMNRAITNLTATIADMAAQAAKDRQEKAYRQTEALPSQFRGQQLVGFESYLTQMRDALRASVSNFGLVVVTGLGGIGKTSLTCEALEGWLSQEAHDARVLWATVDNKFTESTSEQSSLALERVLWQLGEPLELPIAAIPNNKQRLRAIANSLLGNSERFVIVIDNVETPSEVEIALTVASALLPLAQVVVTSRRDIRHNQVRTRVRLRELSEEHALELLRLEAGRHDYVRLSDDKARQLYREVGGHPLALKLVAGQLSFLPLTEVLSALRLNSPLADELYTQVYEISWNLLSELSRELLIGLMLLPVSGGDWEELRFLAQTEDRAALWRVIKELSKLNLLQVSVSSQGAYTYSLHRLTYCFLEHKTGLVDS